MTSKIDKFINSLDQKTREKLKSRLIEIRQNHRESQSKKLQGMEGCYRIRLGKIRIIYKITAGAVEITDIDYRGNIY